MDSPIIGVIGARGELGGEVVTRLVKKGFCVMECDLKLPDGQAIEALFAKCSVIHVCIPSKVITKIPDTSGLVLLHDSVMESSIQLIKRSECKNAVGIHMLMNEEQAVIIDRGAAYKELAKVHLANLGLTTHDMSASEHDTFIQQSQLPLFTLLPLLPRLSKWKEQGLLTPSGEDLMRVLQKRNSSWTPATKESLQEHNNIL